MLTKPPKPALRAITAITFTWLWTAGTPSVAVRADDATQRFTEVNCAPGACEVAAGSVSKPSYGPSRKGPKTQEVHANPGPGGTRNPSAETEKDWEHPVVTMGLFNAGKGIFPLADDEEPHKPKPDAGRHVSVKAVVQRAVKQLKLPKPVIHTSPREDLGQVVHVPTWMWVERKSWKPVTVSVAVEGVEVTATARPRKAVWLMGDGGSVVCRGPGTPYSDRYGPKASSPDCGYTYQRASLREPNGSFTVSVRVSWDVEWHGGGRAGVVPGLGMAAQRQLEVDEVQAVVTH